MERFLDHNKLTGKREYGGDCYLIEVNDQSGTQTDELFCYSLFDVQKVIEFYLKPEGRFWFTVKVTKC